MKNWTIGFRVKAATSLLCVLLVVVGGIAWHNLGTVRDQANELKSDVMPGVIRSSEFATFLAKGFIRTQLYASAPDAAARAALAKEIEETNLKIDEVATAYQATIFRDDDRLLYNKLEAARKVYRESRQAFLALVDAGQAREANALLHGTLAPRYQAYAAAAEAMFAFNASNGDNLALRIDAKSRQTRLAILIVSLAALLGGAIVSWVITRTTNAVLIEVSDQLAAGAEQTASAASQVSASSQSLASGATEQASSLEETSAALTEMASMTKKNSDSASQAKALSNETRQAAETGAASMEEMKKAMDAIKDSASGIGKIVKTIDEIAFQTNILALNAAVEAARAGEAGAGFAVVADEVRSLAQRSAQSAKETADRIEDSVTRSEHGVRISADVARSFEVIVAKARHVDDLVAEIAASSQEQSQGIGQVNAAVLQIDKVTQTNTAGAEEAASAAEELNAQSEMMRDGVRSLQLLVGTAKAAAAPVAAPRVKARDVKLPARHAPIAMRSAPILPEPLQARLNGAPPVTNGRVAHEECFQ